MAVLCAFTSFTCSHWPETTISRGTEESICCRRASLSCRQPSAARMCVTKTPALFHSTICKECFRASHSSRQQRKRKLSKGFKTKQTNQYADEAHREQEGVQISADIPLFSVGFHLHGSRTSLLLCPTLGVQITETGKNMRFTNSAAGTILRVMTLIMG